MLGDGLNSLINTFSFTVLLRNCRPTNIFIIQPSIFVLVVLDKIIRTFCLFIPFIPIALSSFDCIDAKK